VSWGQSVVCSGKELGVVIITVERTIYLPLVLQEDYNNDMFRPYMWAIFGL